MSKRTQAGFTIINLLISIPIMVMMLLAGVFSWNSLRQELLPDIEFPFVTVITPVPGAGAEDVAAGVKEGAEKAKSLSAREAEELLRVQERARDFLRSTEVVANALYASGTVGQTDVLRASVAVARVDGEIRRLQAQRAGAVARLNGVLDRPADTPVP